MTEDTKSTEDTKKLRELMQELMNLIADPEVIKNKPFVILKRQLMNFIVVSVVIEQHKKTKGFEGPFTVSKLQALMFYCFGILAAQKNTKILTDIEFEFQPPHEGIVVSDIYKEFGNGLKDPLPIKFLLSCEEDFKPFDGMAEMHDVIRLYGQLSPSMMFFEFLQENISRDYYNCFERDCFKKRTFIHNNEIIQYFKDKYFSGKPVHIPYALHFQRKHSSEEAQQMEQEEFPKFPELPKATYKSWEDMIQHECPIKEWMK